MGLNKVILCGRLTAHPELRQTDSGIDVCRFSVAVNMGANKVDFFDCVAWRQTATFLCRYFGKGDGVIIVGSLHTRSYEKKGVEVKTVEVVAESVNFPEGGKKEESAPAVPATVTLPTGNATGFEVATDDGDLPF
jgi:single-strand DNA-binding protein